MISTSVFSLESWHPYTQRILNNALNFGTVFPNRSSIVIIDNIVRDFVSCGFWQLLDIFYLFGGNSDVTQTFRCINWINPSKHFGSFLGNIVTGSINIYGLKGNGISGVNGISFLTNYGYISNAVKYTTNNASLGCVTYIDDTSITPDSDSYLSSYQSGRYPSLTPAQLQRINSANTSVSFSLSGTGLKILNRISATTINMINKDNLNTRTLNTATEVTALDTDKLQALRMQAANSSYVSDAGLTIIFAGAAIPYVIAQQVRDIMNNRFYTPLGLTLLA